MKRGKGKKRVAIVTGASSGLGVEFATQLERHFELDEIWLVARRRDRLMTTASLLRRAKGVVIPIDLSTSSSSERLVHRLDQARPDLRVLVNNAGFARYGHFHEIDLRSQLEMLDVNVRALTHLTHAAVPHMGRGSHIIQVSSIAGFFALAKYAAYSATKSYVVHFSYSIRRDLRKKGINVMVCAPGPVATEFQRVATDGKRDKIIMEADPASVVAQALRDLKKGKRISIYGATMRAAHRISRRRPKEEEEDGKEEEDKDEDDGEEGPEVEGTGGRKG